MRSVMPIRPSYEIALDDPLRQHDLSRRSPRGFTILELAISMAIAGIVVAAASTAAVNVTRVLKLEAKKSIADQDARRLVDFVVGRLQGAGGGPVRPWMSIWHEENCPTRNGLPACGKTDHLTIVDVDLFRGPCTIQSALPGSITFGRPDPDEPCCYDWPEGAVVAADEPNQFHAQSLMLVNGRDKWTMVTIIEETRSETCTMSMSSARPLGSWSATVADANIGQFAGGVAVGAATRTLFLGSISSETAGLGTEEAGPLQLLEWFDVNYNAFVDPEEVRVVFPGVYDFQLALGYDANPEDGRVVETTSGADEWWGNRTEVGALTMPLSTLRMGTVGVTIGVKAVDPGVRTVKILNGAALTRSHHVIRAATGRAMLRNIAVFY